MELQSTEIEQRYKVADPEVCIAALAALGIAVASRERVIDQWFAPQHIRSLEEEEDWFDRQKGVAWRIRRIQQSDGGFTVKVDSKQLTEHNSHDTFTEGHMPITDYSQAQAAMAGIAYRNWLTIDKTRYTFNSGQPEIEVVLDIVENLAKYIGVGAALELEYKGRAPRTQALAILEDFAAHINLNPRDRFDRSLTVEAKPVLAKF